jgi:hypothetical protein
MISSKKAAFSVFWTHHARKSYEPDRMRILSAGGPRLGRKGFNSLDEGFRRLSAFKSGLSVNDEEGNSPDAALPGETAWDGLP